MVANRKVQAKAWWQQTPKLQEVLNSAGQLTTGMQAVWQRARGPAGAMWATIKELGGSMDGPFSVQVAGTQWDLREEGPHELLKELMDEHVQQRLQEWAREPGKEELRPCPWILPAKQVMGRT